MAVEGDGIDRGGFYVNLATLDLRLIKQMMQSEALVLLIALCLIEEAWYAGSCL